MSPNRIRQYLPADADRIATGVAADLNATLQGMHHVAPEVTALLTGDLAFRASDDPVKSLILLSRAVVKYQLLFETAEDLADELAKSAAHHVPEGECLEWADWRVTRAGDRLLALPVPTPPKVSANRLEQLVKLLIDRFRRLGGGPVPPPEAPKPEGGAL